MDRVEQLGRGVAQLLGLHGSQLLGRGARPAVVADNLFLETDGHNLAVRIADKMPTLVTTVGNRVLARLRRLTPHGREHTPRFSIIGLDRLLAEFGRLFDPATTRIVAATKRPRDVRDGAGPDTSGAYAVAYLSVSGCQ
jgi:hypothetical protein